MIRARFPRLIFPYGNVAFPHWAAGLKRVLSLAYLLVWSWAEHVQAAELRREQPTDQLVLIIDEVESHLHPKLQRTILPSILRAAEKLQENIVVQVFAATHSPLVLASVEPHFNEERDSLFLFKLEDGSTNVSLRKLPWAKQGDAVGWLTSPVFGLNQARSKEAENAIEAAEAFMRGSVAKRAAGTSDQGSNSP